MDNTGGFTKWDISFFFHFWINGFEFTIGTPGRVRRGRGSSGGMLVMSAGNAIHQAAFLGGNAPVNLAGGRIEMEFSIFAKEEYFRLIEALNRSAYSPVELVLGVWQSDEWYIPGAAQDDLVRSAWLLSRDTAYDRLDIDHVTGDFTPQAWLDDTELTLVATDPPAAGEFYVEPDVAGDRIVTAPGISGSWLRCRYFTKLYLSSVTGEEEAVDDNTWNFSLAGEEALPTRNFSFSVPA